MSLHRYQSPRSLRVLRAEAARATCAQELETVVREITLFHSPLIALGVLGSHHEIASGKKSMDTLREWIVRRMAAVGRVSRPEICRRAGEAMMDVSERLAFARITKKPKLHLVRVTDFTRSSGWYETEEDARESWIHANSFTATETLTVSASEVFAVKSLHHRHDIVLTPGRVRVPERRLLS